ncbi:MAG: Holliday junction branch migration protein RuvA [Actinomycetales bacterium]|nr:Holliday junction branch migration protein RuvA [Actinomycetales bacterium]
MISHLTGTIVSTRLDGVVIDVGGVGMHVLCAPGTSTSLNVGTSATLVTSLVVREDSLTLFGFVNEAERDMWQLVQTVSGIGPKVALAFIAVLSPEDASRALADGDLAALTRVPGIGKKGAERLVVELKDKVLAFGATPTQAAEGWRTQVRDALVGLGWSAKESEKAIDAVARTIPSGHEANVSEILKAALQSMAKGR